MAVPVRRELPHRPTPATARVGRKPVIDQTLPWEEHRTAAARLVSADTHGKIVLTIDA